MNLTAKAALLDRLAVLSRYEDGWDGRLGARADRQGIADAVAFVGLLHGPGPMPDASLHADGAVLLEFEAPGLSASVVFPGSGTLSAYVRRGDEEWDEDLAFDGRTMPPELAARLGPGDAGAAAR